MNTKKIIVILASVIFLSTLCAAEIVKNADLAGHGGHGPTHPNTPVMVLFLDSHAAGPYLYNKGFENSFTIKQRADDLSEKVLVYPND